jgi:phosphate transport system protein
MVRKAIEAFIDGDAELAESVLAMDDEVDTLNSAAFHALSAVIREQPMHTTQALNAMLIARNLERVGDHATNIAEDVIFWVNGRDIRHKMTAASALRYFVPFSTPSACQYSEQM